MGSGLRTRLCETIFRPSPPERSPATLIALILSKAAFTMSTTAAQDEFNELIAKNTVRETLHPDDRNDPDLRQHQDTTEEDDFRQGQIADATRAPSLNGGAECMLPGAASSAWTGWRSRTQSTKTEATANLMKTPEATVIEEMKTLS